MVKIIIDTGDDRPKDERPKTIKLKCGFCGASGRRPNEPFKTCPVCRGRKYNVFNVPPKPEICSVCNGSGRELGFSLQPDPNCRGTGYIQ